MLLVGWQAYLLVAEFAISARHSAGIFSAVPREKSRRFSKTVMCTGYVHHGGG